MQKNSQNPQKTLLVHDTFLMKGGAERMNLYIAKILDADIATAIWHQNCYNPHEMGFSGKIFELNPNFRRGMIGFLKMKISFFLAQFCHPHDVSEKKFGTQKIEKPAFSEKLDFRNYENFFLSNEAISAIWSVPKDKKTFYYAHSISRHLFDLYDEYLAKVPRLARLPYRIFAYFLRKIYIREIQKFDFVFVNSHENQKRLAEWTGRTDGIVLFPPVDTEHFSEQKPQKNSENLQKIQEIFHKNEKKFFLSFARLTHVKGIDKIIRAFQQIPEQNILILFGTEDSQREEFQKLAEIEPTTKQNQIFQSSKFPNIFFLSISDNNELPAIISESQAVVCMSKNEDFGMVAIEAMSGGKPVFAPKEGGYLETIIDEKTGFLLEKNSSESLIAIIRNNKKTDFGAMKDDCRAQAEKFSLKNFEEKLQILFQK